MGTVTSAARVLTGENQTINTYAQVIKRLSVIQCFFVIIDFIFFFVFGYYLYYIIVAVCSLVVACAGFWTSWARTKPSAIIFLVLLIIRYVGYVVGAVVEWKLGENTGVLTIFIGVIVIIFGIVYITFAAAYVRRLFLGDPSDRTPLAGNTGYSAPTYQPIPTTDMTPTTYSQPGLQPQPHQQL